ncbi:MAG: hypothetical protein IPK68_22395 [Bdellovibrionales bacterium]|nr:hypothetical protein [Bdellovibrionales bacterium]
MSIDSLMIVASKSDLVFIGESHLEGKRIRHYRTMFKSLKQADSKFDCLFIEIPKINAQPDLDACNANPGLLNKLNFDSSTEKACEALGSNPWDGPINEAFRQGMKVFAIDATNSQCDSGKKGRIFQMSRRFHGGQHSRPLKSKNLPQRNRIEWLGACCPEFSRRKIHSTWSKNV